jgi:hypothetical protein
VIRADRQVQVTFHPNQLITQHQVASHPGNIPESVNQRWGIPNVLIMAAPGYGGYHMTLFILVVAALLVHDQVIGGGIDIR